MIDWLVRAWSLASTGEPKIDHSWQAAGCGIDPNGAPLLCLPNPDLPPNSLMTNPEGTDPAQ